MRENANTQGKIMRRLLFGTSAREKGSEVLQLFWKVLTNKDYSLAS